MMTKMQAIKCRHGQASAAIAIVPSRTVTDRHGNTGHHGQAKPNPTRGSIQTPAALGHKALQSPFCQARKEQRREKENDKQTVKVPPKSHASGGAAAPCCCCSRVLCTCATWCPERPPFGPPDATRPPGVHSPSGRGRFSLTTRRSGRPASRRVSLLRLRSSVAFGAWAARNSPFLHLGHLGRPPAARGPLL